MTIKKRPLQEEDYLLFERDWQFVQNAMIALGDRYQSMESREDSLTKEECEKLHYYEELYMNLYQELHKVPKADGWETQILRY